MMKSVTLYFLERKKRHMFLLFNELCCFSSDRISEQQKHKLIILIGNSNKDILFQNKVISLSKKNYY